MQVALSLAVVTLAAATTSSSAVSDEPQRLIGPICHGEPPPLAEALLAKGDAAGAAREATAA